MNGTNRSVNPLLSKPLKQQQGMTMISMAIIIVMIVFIALIAIRLFPVYLEHWKMKSHIEAIAEAPETAKMSNSEISKTLMKRFDIDDIENIKAEHIFFEKTEGGGLLIAVEYEVRTQGIGNVDMVVSFMDEVIVR